MRPKYACDMILLRILYDILNTHWMSTSTSFTFDVKCVCERIIFVWRLYGLSSRISWTAPQRANGRRQRGWKKSHLMLLCLLLHVCSKAIATYKGPSSNSIFYKAKDVIIGTNMHPRILWPAPFALLSAANWLSAV